MWHSGGPSTLPFPQTSTCLVLLERAVRTTQEPLAERHVRLDFALLAGEAVVLDAEQGVERERGLGKLVCVPTLYWAGA